MVDTIVDVGPQTLIIQYINFMTCYPLEAFFFGGGDSVWPFELRVMEGGLVL